MSVVWGTENVLSLLELYQSHDFLWDTSNRDYRNKQKKNSAWEDIAKTLKFPRKDVEAKVHTLRSQFIREKKKISALNTPGSGQEEVKSSGWFAYDAMKFLLKGETTSGNITKDDCTWEIQVEGPSKPKKPALKVKSPTFSIVKKCCIALVKEHGHAITMFDEKAFKILIDLLPLSSSQKGAITSENIQRMLDGGDDEEDEAEYEVAVEVSRDDDDDDVPTPMKIKKEKLQCTCSARDDPDDTNHNEDCPKYTDPAYWTYFAVSVDEATCSLCKEVISWTDISTLKDHLTNKHPDVKFIDDDDTFQRGPPSSPGSREDMEEVYLPDDDYLPSRRDDGEPKRKRPRGMMPNVNMSRDELADSLQDRFKSLDCFGLYVASLMKLLPRDKCVKFQIQIVERLLREQAAAG